MELCGRTSCVPTERRSGLEQGKKVSRGFGKSRETEKGEPRGRLAGLDVDFASAGTAGFGQVQAQNAIFDGCFDLFAVDLV